MPATGRIELRMEPEMKQQIEDAAYAARMSVTKYVMTAVEAHMAAATTPAPVKVPEKVHASKPAQKIGDKVQPKAEDDIVIPPPPFGYGKTRWEREYRERLAKQNERGNG